MSKILKWARASACLVTKYLSRLCSIPALFYWSWVFCWTQKFQVPRGLKLCFLEAYNIFLESKYAVFNYYHFDFYKCLNGMFFCIYQFIERSSLRNLLSGIGCSSLPLLLIFLRAQYFLNLRLVTLLTISYGYTLNLDIFSQKLYRVIATR